MQHTIVAREEGVYNAFPVLHQLADGRLSIGCISSPFADHWGMGGWSVFTSADEGQNWDLSDDPALPFNWPGEGARERYDRLCGLLPDGTFMAVGSIGQEPWDPERRAEAEARGLRIHDDELITSAYGGRLVVGGHRLAVVRSADDGASWERRIWTVPGYASVVAFPRGTILTDGTWLLPIYAYRADNSCDGLIFRSTDGGESWSLHLAVERVGSEWALIETEPGRVLGHIRQDLWWGPPQTRRMHTLEVWSEDGGRTWTQPLETAFEGYPNHLLKLGDGRLLCSHGYRRQPMGVRALISEDGGRSWDLDHEYVLRDDAGTVSNQWPDHHRQRHGSGGADVGYPLSVEVADGRIVTAYYITPADGTTHVAVTHWHPDEDRPQQ